MRLPDPQNSHIVLIGTSEYADHNLPNLSAVSRTIEAVRAAFTDPVYGLVPSENCSVLLDEGDLRLIGRRLREAASSAADLLLVYYSGHGLIGGRRHELYLGLHDSESADPDFNSLEYEKLRNAVLDSTAKTKVIVLDCCFSGRAVSHTMADAVSEAIGQAEVDGTCVLMAAAANKVALILPDEELTAFSGRLLDILRKGVPGAPEFLSLDRVYQELQRVMRAEGLPRPQNRMSDLAGLLALARNRAYRPRTDEDPAVRLGAVRELKRLLLGEDLKVAASTCPVLAQYANDRNREVAEAARKALDEARIQPDPDCVDFGRVQWGTASPHVTIRLLGPPIARKCESRMSHGWILLEHARDSLDVSLDTSGTGPVQGKILLEGPIGPTEIDVAANLFAIGPTPASVPPPRRVVVSALPGGDSPLAPRPVVSSQREAVSHDLPDVAPVPPQKSRAGFLRGVSTARKFRISAISAGVAAVIGAATWIAIPSSATPGAVKAAPRPRDCTVYSGNEGSFSKPAGIAVDPASVPVGSRHLWVANYGKNSVTELNPASGKVVQTLSGRNYGFSGPTGIASDGTHVWVANSGDNSVTELNANGGSLVAVIRGSQYGFSGPGEVTSDGNHVFVVNFTNNANSVTEFSASDPSSAHYISSGSFQFSVPSDVTIDGRHVWVMNSGAPSVSEFQYPDGPFIKHEYIGNNSDSAGPTGITFDGNHVWAVDGDESVSPSQVGEFDPSSGDKVKVVTGKQYKFKFPEGITSGGGHVWVANDGNDSVTELNSSDGSLAHVFTGSDCKFSFGQSSNYNVPTPTPIVFDGTNVWAANYDGNSVTEIRPRSA